LVSEHDAGKPANSLQCVSENDSSSEILSFLIPVSTSIKNTANHHIIAAKFFLLATFAA